MRLLVAVDTITTLDIILNAIEARSWPNGTEADILSVVEDETIPAETWRTEGYGLNAVRREMRRRGEQVNALAIERLQAMGIPAQVTIMRGDPAFLIPYAAQNWSSDLILIRANNRMDFRNWLLGSVAKSVVEYAECSVEVVRAPTTARSGMRILIATDGSDAASETVAEMKFPEDIEIKVVSAINSIRYSLEEIGVLRGKETERAHHAIGKAIKAIGSAPLKITAEVIAGSGVRSILNRAKDWNADLIVAGDEERSGLQQLMSRGTAVGIANRAHCSVRVIRRKSAARDKQQPSSRLKTEPDTEYGLDSLSNAA